MTPFVEEPFDDLAPPGVIVHFVKHQRAGALWKILLHDTVPVFAGVPRQITFQFTGFSGKADIFRRGRFAGILVLLE
ncbi:MAG TPA: hypothetical protein VLX68_13900 [Chitinivibrionales bacterium]|nr:hypothetical protein [Chitinivibrionales bacterium]